ASANGRFIAVNEVIGPQELSQLWKDLAADAPQAHRAIWSLANAGKVAVSFLQERVSNLEKPKPVAPETVAQWIEQLDNDDFKVREAAIRQLERAGRQAESGLRKA